jgi:peptide/nickel transport system permease protein
MRAYVIRRLLLLVPTLIMVSILVFMVVRFIPGSVIDLMVAEMSMEASLGQQISQEYIKHSLGLDVPVHIQYLRWLGVMPKENGEVKGVVQGDLGNSLWSGRSITAEMGAKIPVSFELGLFALVTALVIALPIGIYSAMRQDTWGDYAGRTFAILAISLPGFWIATMVIVYPSIWWGWSPSMEYIPFFKDPAGNIFQFAIPGMIMGLTFSGATMRMTRTMMLEVLRQDYIRTAWSKGLSERTVIMRHALKNALIPVVTVVGMQLPILISGAVITEQIFALPGIGRFLVDAINRRDYPIISGINLVVAVVVLAANLLVDLTYAWLDPRVQYR